MASRSATDPRPDRAKREFAELFDAYLKQGQRGDGTLERRWSPWENNEFAGIIGVSPNTIGNWRKPDRRIVPTDIRPVLGALFGDDPKFSHERTALEIIWKQAKGLMPLDEEGIGEEELKGFFLSRQPLFDESVPPRINLFTGRDAELERLHAILTQTPDRRSSRLRRAAVPGMGGVGKTTLAVEYAHRYRDHYDGVWWCRAEEPIQLLTGLAKLATELGVATEAEADIGKAAKAAVRWLTEQRANFLLVYDGAAVPGDIIDLLPAGGARVLITSRFVDWQRWAEEVPLDVLPLPEAVSFLQERTGRQDGAGATALAVVLGCLPLALDHAAAFCSLTQMSFAEYAAKAEKLIAIDPPRGTNYPWNVAATFNIAIAEVVRRCLLAESLMDYLAQCGPERIPLTLVEGAIADEAERMAALLALTEMSLVKRDPFEDGTPAVTVHRLVQTVARVRTDADRATAAIERLILRLAAIYPNDAYANPASWPLCEQLTPHLPSGRVTNTADEAASAETADLLGAVADYFHGRAAYSHARPLYERALAIRETALGPDHPQTANSLGDLALLLLDQGDYAGARPLVERGLAIRETALGPDHPSTATSLQRSQERTHFCSLELTQRVRMDLWSVGQTRRYPTCLQATIPWFDCRNHSSVPTWVPQDMVSAGGQ
jgi:tetratricopeptide (TPR) repeat protein